MKQSLKKFDVEQVFAGGKIFKTPAFLLRWRTSSEPNGKIAFVFSRHCGSSVERHAFKRRFREVLRLHGQMSHIHLVVLPRKKLGLVSKREWLGEKQRLEQFLAKATQAKTISTNSSL